MDMDMDMDMDYRKKHFFFVSFCLMLLSTSCGRLPSQKLDRKHHKLIERGKRVAYQPLARAQSFSLVQPKGAITVKQEKGAAFLAYVAYDTSLGESLKKEDLKEHALSYVASHFEFFHVPKEELFLFESGMKSLKNSNLISINFYRKIDGYLLRDAFLEVVYAKMADGDYSLREIINHTYGTVILEEKGEPLQVASYMANHYGPLEIVEERRLIFPEKSPFGGYLFHLASEVTVLDDKKASYTLTFLDGDKEPIEVYSHQHEIEGSLKGLAFDRSYKESSPQAFPLPFTEFLIDDNLHATDSDGLFALDEASEAVVGLSSKRVNVFDALSSDLVTFPVTLKEGENVVGESNGGVKALNTYTAVHRIHGFARQFLLSDVDFLKRSVNVVINVEGACNAYYDTRKNSLHFFVEGKGCADTALLNDVVFHEWGHALDFYTGRNSGITDGAFSEGLSDVVATYFTGKSVVGSGFFLDKISGIRDVNELKVFPKDKGGVHDEGVIIGGAFWNLRKALMERYGENRGAYMAADLFFNHLLTTDSYHESYQTLLRLDDDDGNPKTPSPNHCLINKVFTLHGLAEDEKCQDEGLPERPAPMALHMAIMEEGEGFSLAASSDVLVSDIAVCVADIFACLEKQDYDEVLVFEGVSEDDRHIFKGEKSHDLSEFSIVTLLARDGEGEVIGYRSLKMVGK